MLFLNLLKMICLSFLVGSAVLFGANKEYKIYGTESGQILYEIEGEGQLTQETNLTISGTARLRFKEWGAVALAEEKGTVMVVGAIRGKQTFRSLIKQEKDTAYYANYKTEKVLERKSSSKFIAHGESLTKGLKQTGTLHVNGWECEVWEGPGVKKCLYKGIPLLLEIQLYGMTYTKKASDISFDINLSEDQCVMPDFSVEEFGLIRGIGMTKNKKKPKEVIEVFRDILKGNFIAGQIDNNDTNQTHHKAKIEFINRLGQSIYKDQKVLLPKLLFDLEKSRECIHQAETPKEANECIRGMRDTKKEMGVKMPFIYFWNDEEKDMYLEQLDNEISNLKSRMSCISFAKNITELSACMK